ncbi:TPA: hypothetical protein ACNFJZ_005287, partial [Escherichia coli]
VIRRKKEEMPGSGYKINVDIKTPVKKREPSPRRTKTPVRVKTPPVQHGVAVRKSPLIKGAVIKKPSSS